MDGRTDHDEQTMTDRHMTDGWTDGQTDGQSNGRPVGLTDKHMMKQIPIHLQTAMRNIGFAALQTGSQYDLHVSYHSARHKSIILSFYISQGVVSVDVLRKFAQKYMILDIDILSLSDLS